MHEKSERFKAFNLLEELIKEKFISNKNDCISIDFSDIGISNFQRLISIIKSIKYFGFSKNRARLNLSNLIFINYYHNSNFYIKNIKDFLKANNIAALITS